MGPFAAGYAPDIEDKDIVVKTLMPFHPPTPALPSPLAPEWAGFICESGSQRKPGQAAKIEGGIRED